MRTKKNYIINCKIGFLAIGKKKENTIGFQMLVLILSHPLQEFNHTVDRNTTDWGRTSVLSIKKINKIQKKKKYPAVVSAQPI